MDKKHHEMLIAKKNSVDVIKDFFDKDVSTLNGFGSLSSKEIKEAFDGTNVKVHLFDDAPTFLKKAMWDYKYEKSKWN